MGELILDRIGCAITRGHLRLAQAKLRWRLRFDGEDEQEIRDTLAEVEKALDAVDAVDEIR